DRDQRGALECHAAGQRHRDDGARAPTPRRLAGGRCAVAVTNFSSALQRLRLPRHRDFIRTASGPLGVANGYRPRSAWGTFGTSLPMSRLPKATTMETRGCEQLMFSLSPSR